MPVLEPGQEPLPDFFTHPDYQVLFNTLVAGGQDREQATLLLADLWLNRGDHNTQRAEPHLQEPQPLPQPRQA